MNFAPHGDWCKCWDCTVGVSNASEAAPKREPLVERIVQLESDRGARRKCRFCQTQQAHAKPCAHCGAPDDGD